MKYVETNGDVRATSANPAYMGVVFQGTIDEAIVQAKAQPDHGVPAVNGRAELLSFHRVTLARRFTTPWERAADKLETEFERDLLVPPPAPPKPWDGFSPYSLEYAMARWPQCFKH